MLSFLIRVANLKQGIPCFKLLLFCSKLLELSCCSFNLSFQILCTSLQVTLVGSWELRFTPLPETKHARDKGVVSPKRLFCLRV